jgi:hypothetical protein
MATPAASVFDIEEYTKNGGILLNIVKRSPDYTESDARRR